MEDKEHELHMGDGKDRGRVGGGEGKGKRRDRRKVRVLAGSAAEDRCSGRALFC